MLAHGQHGGGGIACCKGIKNFRMLIHGFFAPPELGEHTLELLQSGGLDAETCKALLNAGAVEAVNPENFLWAPVRQEA